MKVNEIFSSIDGEGIRAGELATFIRLAGCNLRCNYCDTKYALAQDSGKEMTVSEILEKVNEFNVKNITVTGGEPLIHKDIEKLIDKLIENGYKVNIEDETGLGLGENHIEIAINLLNKRSKILIK